MCHAAQGAAIPLLPCLLLAGLEVTPFLGSFNVRERCGPIPDFGWHDSVESAQADHYIPHLRNLVGVQDR